MFTGSNLNLKGALKSMQYTINMKTPFNTTHRARFTQQREQPIDNQLFAHFASLTLFQAAVCGLLIKMQQAEAHQARIQQLETFINDVLKEDLKQLEQYINQYNDEIMEYVQLKNTLQTFEAHMPDGYKTQVNIGSNMFMQARVNQMNTILVNIGKNMYLEMDMQEAQRFCELRIKILTKESDVLREESVKKRAQIKMTLLAISEREKLLQNEDKH